VESGGASAQRALPIEPPYEPRPAPVPPKAVEPTPGND
jgi:hypothetical protein